MGRDSTGAITVGSCLQLRIKHFIKIIKEGNCNKPYSIQWEGGASIGFTLRDTNGGYFLELKYEKTEEGKKVPIKYQVLLLGKPSNLGKGTVYHFVCPFNMRFCKILYMGYGCRYFKSREAYSHRIYYPSQLSSRLSRHNEAFFRMERQLKDLYPKHPKSHYRGQETRAGVRLRRLEERMAYHDDMMWRVFPVAVMKSLGAHMGADVRQFF